MESFTSSFDSSFYFPPDTPSSQPSSLLSDQLDNLTPEFDPFNTFNSSPPSSSPPASSDDSINTKPRPRTCWVYKHMPDLDVDTKYHNQTTNKLEWRCKYCPKKYTVNGGTRCIKAHLKYSHEVTELSPRAEKAQKRQRSIEEAMVAGTGNPQKRRFFEVIDNDNLSTPSTLNPDALEVLYVNLVASCNLPLRFVQCEAFREFIQYLNPTGNALLPESHTKIQEWLIRQFQAGKEQTKQLLQLARTAIHLSLDMWTSANHLAILGIIAHYISEEGTLQECLLAMKVVDGRHTGENLSQYVLQVIQDYGITSRLGYLQMDNASNNDSLIRVLSVGMSFFILFLYSS
jgi:hypothetical protein